MIVGEMNLAAVGGAIRRLRQAKRLKLEDVSSASGVDTGNLSRIERGTLGWSLDTLTQISQKGLRVTVSEVFSEAERGDGVGGVGSIAELAMSVPIVKLDDLREGNLRSALKKSVERVRTTASVGRNAFAFRVSGNVMFPEFRDKEVVIIDPDIAPTFDHYVLVALEDSVVFRQLEEEGGKTYLNAKAKGYEAIQLRPRKHQILGVAAQAIRDLV